MGRLLLLSGLIHALLLLLLPYAPIHTTPPPRFKSLTFILTPPSENKPVPEKKPQPQQKIEKKAPIQPAVATQKTSSPSAQQLLPPSDVMPPVTTPQPPPVLPSAPPVTSSSPSPNGKPLNLQLSTQQALTALGGPGPATPPGATGPTSSKAGGEVLPGLANLAPANTLMMKRNTEFKLSPDGQGGYRYEGPNFKATIQKSGEVVFKNRLAKYSQGTLSFDLADAAIRLGGQDPYAVDKQRFLAQTRELRMQLLQNSREDELYFKLQALREELAQIVNSPKPLSDRKRALVQLWVGFNGDGAGARARRTIEKYVRDQWPEQSPQAFTERDLEQLRSEFPEARAFNPYSGV